MGGPFLFCGSALAAAEELVASGMDRRRASFELSFEAFPRHVGFAVIAGVEQALEACAEYRVEGSALRAAVEANLISEVLAARLSKLELRLDIDAVPEGTVVFPHTPVVSLEGPLLDAVLLKPLLASCIERASTAATACARLVIAADGDAIIEATSASEADTQSALGIARAGFVGGALATTNMVAAVALQIPFRAPRLETLAGLIPRAQGAVDGWGSLAEEVLLPLLPDDDEEAALVEAKRLRRACDGWLAARLTGSPRNLRARFELVALEEDGAWRPHATDEHLPGGRKILVRYLDRDGRPVADVVHLHNERMMSERSFGATALAPLALARVRGGRRLAATEPASNGRQRLLAARRKLPPDVCGLRGPASFRVERSGGVRALEPE